MMGKRGLTFPETSCVTKDLEHATVLWKAACARSWPMPASPALRKVAPARRASEAEVHAAPDDVAGPIEAVGEELAREGLVVRRGHGIAAEIEVEVLGPQA